MSEEEVEVSNIEDLKYDERGLIPAIVQEESTGQVLMLAYMNRESLGRLLRAAVRGFSPAAGKSYGPRERPAATSKRSRR